MRRSIFILSALFLASVAHAAPEVSILAPTTAAVGDDVILESQVLDPGEGDLAYSWFQSSGVDVQLTSRNLRNTSFIVPSNAAGTRIVIQLIASDRLTSSAPAVATISIAGSATPNNAPVAVPGAAVTLRSGQSAQLDGTGSRDPDGDTLTYNWQQLSGTKAALTGADLAKVTVTAPKNIARAEALTIRLTVTDTRGATGSAAIAVNLEPSGCSCATTTVPMAFLAALALLLRRRVP